MSASVKLIHRLSKRKRSSGDAPIYLRITRNRKSRFIATGVAVLPKDWNETKQEVRTSHDLADAYNHRLKGLAARAEETLLKGGSAEHVKAALVGSAGDFVRFCESFIARCKENDRFWEARKYEVLLRKCQRCLGKDIGWKNLDKGALEKFETYLRVTIKNSPNTIRKEMSRLRRLCNQAIKDGDLAPSDNPFLRYSLPMGQKIERRKLTLAEIAALEQVGLEPESTLELARDAFLLAFYGGGIRFGDLCTLTVTEASEGRVKYKAMKTGATLSVPLPAKGIALVEKYSVGKEATDRLFPLLSEKKRAARTDIRMAISSSNVMANKRIKAVAELAGISSDGLSTHVARHSFADLARRMGGDVHAIKQALGHSDISVTQTYLKSLDADAVDQLAAKMWS